MGNETVLDIFSGIGEEQQNRREREAQRRFKERMQERMRRERENLQRRQEIEREENRRREERFREMMERERENQRERMNQRNFQNNNPFFFNRREGQEINNGDLAGIIFRNLFNIHNNNNNYNNNNNNYNNNNNNIFNNINFNDNEGNNPNNNENKNENNIIVDMIEEIELTQDIINKAETKECSICLEEYYIYNKISYLPCFHFFHTTCIKNWLKNSKKCPLCNIEVKFE